MTSLLSLMDLVSQNQPHFQTHQALLVIGLQNDFIQPDGKLPVSTRSGFVDRIHTIIPKFRQLSANVIWIQTLYETDRLANDPSTGEGDAVVVGGLADGESSSDDDEDSPKELLPPTQSRSSKHKQRALDLLKRVSAKRKTVPREVAQASIDEDEELFLLKSAKNGPACMPNTPGADFIDVLKPRIEPSDAVLRTTNYSAFQGTSLLLILRAKLVTELYICGCITNVSVLATVIDAARHGIKINVVEDCLGFRKRARHEVALKRMIEFFDANMVTSSEILSRDSRDDNQKETKVHNGSKDASEELRSLTDKLQLNEANPTRQPNSQPTQGQKGGSPTIALNGRQRTLSDTSVAESRTTTDSKLSDDQFAEILTQGAKVPGSDQNQQPAAAKQSLVKSKIRMRTRSDRSKKEDSQKSKLDAARKVETGSRHTPVDQATTNQQRARTPKAEPTEVPRPSITKAESSDKLRDTTLKPQSLKTSSSQPSLSSSSVETKEKKRALLALSRAPRSDSTKLVPTKEPSSKPPIKPAEPEPPKSTSTKQPTMSKKLQSLATFPVLGPGDRIAEGDSKIIHNFLPPDLKHPSDPSKPLKDLIFHQLFNEVRWQKMLHQQGEVPRLVCCQGEFSTDGSIPVYRHPTDQVLPLLHFSPKVQVIRKQAEKLVGHPLNHVLIQLYRSGNDYISEHSDKTLDIVRGTSIVNVSFGAQRTMRLRTKKAAKADDSDENAQRETQRVAMPHNSMFVLGLKSNEKWLHGIMADKRAEAERSEAEKAFSGIRISLTFRHIGTFLDAENSTIWGQGAVSKEQKDAGDVINDDDVESERMIRAFSRENHSPDFDWDEFYGDGFDVLHLHSPPEDLPILFASHNPVETAQVQLFLWESKINHSLCEAPALEKQYELDRQVCYRDADVNHTEVVVPVPILLYLDRYHPMDRDDRGRACCSASYEIFIMISALLKYWMNRHVPTYYTDFVNLVDTLEERCKFGPGPFIAGRRFSIGDCYAWPVIDNLVAKWDGWSEERYPCLSEYYRMLWKKKASVKKLRKELPDIKKRMSEKD